MTRSIFWTLEAKEDLLDARAWYDNIRPALGERFALAVEVTVEAIGENPLRFQLFIEGVGVRVCAAFRTEYFLKSRSIGSW